MKKILLASILFIVFACGKAQTKEIKQTNAKEEITTYYFIRHSEKNRASRTKNPNLLEKGQDRAENWAHYFKSVAFDAVYSTNYNRTKQTATPTANKTT